MKELDGSGECMMKSTNKELAKQKIREILDRAPKCPKCGAEMSRYPYYDEHYEYNICESCGYTVRKERVGVR